MTMSLSTPEQTYGKLVELPSVLRVVIVGDGVATAERRSRSTIMGTRRLHAWLTLMGQHNISKPAYP